MTLKLAASACFHTYYYLIPLVNTAEKLCLILAFRLIRTNSSYVSIKHAWHCFIPYQSMNSGDAAVESNSIHSSCYTWQPAYNLSFFSRPSATSHLIYMIGSSTFHLGILRLHVFVHALNVGYSFAFFLLC